MAMTEFVRYDVEPSVNGCPVTRAGTIASSANSVLLIVNRKLTFAPWIPSLAPTTAAETRISVPSFTN